MGWSAPNIFYKHELSNLVASSTDATGDFDVAYLLNRLEIDFWKAANTTVPMYIDFDAGIGKTITSDYLAISGHNLNTIGATIVLQCSFYNFGYFLTDKITNGGFDTDTTGWTEVAANIGSIAGGQAGNCLIIATNSAAPGSAYQDVTDLTIDYYYKMQVYFKKGTGPSGGIKVGTTSDDDVYGTHTGLTDAGWTAYSIEFQATDRTARITFVNEATSSGQSALFDSVVLYEKEITDCFTEYTPSNDLTLVKKFTPKTKRFWRLKITGTLSAAPYMAICYWGEAVSLGLVSSSFDPHTEEKHADVIVSHHGYLQEVDEQWVERPFTLNFSKSNDPLYQKIKDLWNTVGLLLFVIQWEPTDHADDIWLMRIKNKKFENLLVEKGLYRDIPLQLTGRME